MSDLDQQERAEIYEAIDWHGHQWTPELAEAVGKVITRREQHAAQDERARIAWWLRQAADGPGAPNTPSDYLTAVRDIADAIVEHPERFAEAPGWVDQRARQLQARGPDEYPLGYYRHLAEQERDQ